MPASTGCIAALWLAWLIVWFLAARQTAKTVVRQSPAARLAHSVLVWGGAVLLTLRARLDNPLLRPVVLHRAWTGWATVGAVALGLGFAVWARIHLGQLWSATVTLKQDHVIIRTGPYRVTRHPIYTGLLLALGATAFDRGTIAGFVGFILIFLGLMLKVRQEEALLLEHFGVAYDAYRTEVPALIPGVRRRGSRDVAS
jgi:protein-S-isoprenylcysteine O-methyltransferase Ste14